MNRRQFVTSGALAAAVVGAPPMTSAAATPARALMKLGATVADGGEGGRGAARGGAAGTEGAGVGRRGSGQPRDVEKGFKSLGRWGIKNAVATAEIADGRLYATVDELNRLTGIADKYGAAVDILNPPFLPSSHIDRERHPAIMLADSPQRDRDIEQIQTMIKTCAAAKIPCIKIQHEHPRSLAHPSSARPRRYQLQRIQVEGRSPGSAPHRRRGCGCRPLLGENHVLS